MSVINVVRFGSDEPSNHTGLSPTFILCYNLTFSTLQTPPSISEVPTSFGLYQFTNPNPNNTIAFVIDGATTGLSSVQRYVAGSLDPVQNIDAQIGTFYDSFGTTLTDPATVFGYLKRAQEFMEGDSVISKSSGVWQIWSRGNTYQLGGAGGTLFAGSSTQLTQKILIDNGVTVQKS